MDLSKLKKLCKRNRPGRLLHTHPKLEKELLLNKEHCIVDAKDVERALTEIPSLIEEVLMLRMEIDKTKNRLRGGRGINVTDNV